VSAASRNIELKARNPDPADTLDRALAFGARDAGEIRQRDTYLAGAHGRLKLREQEPGDDELIQYHREEAAEVRTSEYRRLPVPDAVALREALDAAHGTLVVVDKRRRLLLWENVRIHLDEVEGLGSFVELEAVAEEGSDLSEEHSKVERLREQLGIAAANLVASSYSDMLLDAPETLLRAAEAAMRNAHAPYSQFPVGAALRASGGGIYTGANVENAAYPQGQCAEASAIGALVAGGGGRIAEVVVAAPSRELCTPCGGCRQRLREFTADDAPIHLIDLERVRRSTSLGELLPLSFGPDHLAA
jgi:homotetrameric cytidine deaminase